MYKYGHILIVFCCRIIWKLIILLNAEFYDPALHLASILHPAKLLASRSAYCQWTLTPADSSLWHLWHFCYISLHFVTLYDIIVTIFHLHLISTPPILSYLSSRTTNGKHHAQHDVPALPLLMSTMRTSCPFHALTICIPSYLHMSSTCQTQTFHMFRICTTVFIPS